MAKQSSIESVSQVQNYQKYFVVKLVTTKLFLAKVFLESD